MNKEQLLVALDQAGPAYAAARAALLLGDAFEVWNEPVPTSELLDIYERRENHTRSLGLTTLGFPEAVRELTATTLPALRLGHIDGSTPPRHFQLFVSPHDGRVIACLAVPA